MASTTSELVMGDLIDETLMRLHAVNEHPRPVALSGDITDVATTLQLDNDFDELVHPTQVLEIDQELVLVTKKSASSQFTFTVQRGYLGSTAAAHTSGTPVLIDPKYPRFHVQRAIVRCFQMLNSKLPFLVTTEYTNTSGNNRVALSALDMGVVQVRYVNSQTGSVRDLEGLWRFEDRLPASVEANGKALVVHSNYGMTGTKLLVTTQRQWAFDDSPPTEASSIFVTTGAEDLPVLYAVAYLVAGGEMSKLDIDRVEDWSQEQAIRQGVNRAMVRDAWSQFYQRLDEARDIQRTPKTRPFVRRKKVLL